MNKNLYKVTQLRDEIHPNYEAGTIKVKHIDVRLTKLADIVTVRKWYLIHGFNENHF